MMAQVKAALMLAQAVIEADREMVEDGLVCHADRRGVEPIGAEMLEEYDGVLAAIGAALSLLRAGQTGGQTEGLFGQTGAVRHG